jgi:hypothetical protein
MEPPLLLTELIVLGMFVWLGVAAARGFRTPTG